jgi:hypothetical protein
MAAPDGGQAVGKNKLSIQVYVKRPNFDEFYKINHKDSWDFNFLGPTDPILKASRRN